MCIPIPTNQGRVKKPAPCIYAVLCIVYCVLLCILRAMRVCSVVRGACCGVDSVDVPIQSLHNSPQYVLQARERLGDHGVAVDDVGEVHEGVLLLERLLGAEPHGEVLGRVRVQLVPDEGRKKEEGRR